MRGTQRFRSIVAGVFYFGALIVACLLNTLPTQGRKVAAEADEVTSRLYNKYYMEAVCQGVIGNSAAQYQLLKRALQFKPNSPEALYDLAKLTVNHPLASEGEAIALYRKAQQFAPDNNDIRWDLAKIEIIEGQVDSATAHLKCLVADPLKRQQAYILLSDILERSGKHDEELVQLASEWETNEGWDENISLIKVRAFNRLQRWSQSHTLIDSLIQNDPQNSYYPFLKAETYLLQGDTARACETNRFLEKEFPQDPHAQLFKITYYQKKHYNDSLNAEVERLITNPKQDEDTRAAFWRDYIKMSYKSPQDAPRIDSLFAIMVKQPMKSSVLIDLYAAYLSQRKAPNKDFLPVLTKRLELDPSDKEMRVQHAWLLFASKQYEAAIESVKIGIPHNPAQLNLYIIGGNSYSLLNQQEKGLEMFKSGLNHVGECEDKEIVSDYFSAFGDLTHKVGRAEECYALYDSSLVYNPNNPSTLNNYAYFLSLEEKDLDKADSLASRAVKYQPDEPTYLDTYAWVKFVLQDYAAAEKYIQKALSFVKDEENDAALYDHAGDIYFHLGKTDEALGAWKRAAELKCDNPVLAKKIKDKKYYKNPQP